MSEVREYVIGKAWSSMATRCGCCKRKRDTFRINKRAGGSYNRAQRRYHASICAGCALEMVPHAGTHAMATTSGYDVKTLVAIADGIDTAEAREVVAAYKARWQADQR